MLRLAKFLGFLILIISGTFFHFSCKRQVPHDDAIKHLRAFDNEMLGILRNFQRTRSFKLLQEMLAVKDVPAPFFAHESEFAGGVPKFSMADKRGIYWYDSVQHRFMRQAPSDSIIINYSLHDNRNKLVQLIISGYSEEESSSSLMIPTLIQACLLIDGQRTAEITHFARVEHQLPVEARLRIEFESSRLEMDMTSRLRRTYADARIRIKAFYNSESKADGRVRSRFGFTDDGALLLRSLRVQASVFPVFVKARINNDAINPYATDFVEEFNRHSNIRVLRLRDKRTLGEILLKTREASDKLDYAFQHPQGEAVFLEDLMLTVKELMNIKK